MACRNNPTFLIKLRNTSLVLDVEGGEDSRQDGAAVICWTANNNGYGSPNQFWHFRPNGTIQSCGTNLVLDFANGRPRNQPNLIVWEEHGQENQQFSVNGYQIINPTSGAALSTFNGEYQEGARMCMGPKTGQPNQQWELVFAGMHNH